jgi:vitamin B12/bleomycin/antimicrobial peptide transport system ATP-binding/permease protein
MITTTTLIANNSGCGKSSLLRAISGLWTHGSGIIERPTPSDTMFLPQKPYMPLLDLRGQLMYPRESNSSNSASANSDNDAVLLQALQTVRLGHIAHR